MLSCLELLFLELSFLLTASDTGFKLGRLVAGALGREVGGGGAISTGGLLLSLMTLLLGRLGGGVPGGSLLTGVDGVDLAAGTGGAALFLLGGAVAGVGGPFAWKDLARALTTEPLGAGSGGPDCFGAMPGLGGLTRPPGRGGRSGPPELDILLPSHFTMNALLQILSPPAHLLFDAAREYLQASSCHVVLIAIK